MESIPQEMEDDFLTDPELLRDNLPQPYRMIDKTLSCLLDDTWEIIAKLEEDKLAEANRVRPPMYEPSVQLDAVVPGTLFPDKEVSILHIYR